MNYVLIYAAFVRAAFARSQLAARNWKRWNIARNNVVCSDYRSDDMAESESNNLMHLILIYFGGAQRRCRLYHRHCRSARTGWDRFPHDGGYT